MVLKVKNACLSAFFAALGPFFNKQATLDEDRKVYQYFISKGVRWAIYPFDVTCLILMLWVNTIAVKYKMLSYKHDGAFLGTSLIFILGYLFSALLDFIYDGGFLTLKQTLGVVMMIAGIILISTQEETDQVRKRTNTLLGLLGNMDFDQFDNDALEEDKTNFDAPLIIDDCLPDSGTKDPDDALKASNIDKPILLERQPEEDVQEPTIPP